MKIPVIVRSISNNGFRAEGALPISVTAEGATRAEALEKLRQVIKDHLSGGTELTYLDLGEPENPWLKIAGAYVNEPYFDDYLQAIAEYRRQVNDDPDRP